MSEHGFLALMPGFAVFETLALVSLLGFFVHRIHRTSGQIKEKNEQIEGMIAATYLEARRALRRSR